MDFTLWYHFVNIAQSFRKVKGTPLGIKQLCELPFAAPILLFMELQKVWCPIKLSEKVIEHLDFVASNLHFWLMLKWIRMESWLSVCSSISAVHWKPIIVECRGLQWKWLGRFGLSNRCGHFCIFTSFWFFYDLQLSWNAGAVRFCFRNQFLYCAYILFYFLLQSTFFSAAV